MVVVDGRLQVQYVVGTGRELIDGSGRWQIAGVVCGSTGRQLIDGSGRWQIAGVVCGRYWRGVSRWQWQMVDCRWSMWQLVDGSGRWLICRLQYVVGTGQELIDGSGRWQIAGGVCGRYWTVVNRWQIAGVVCGRYWTVVRRWQRQMVDLQVQYVVGTGWQLVDGSDGGRWQIAGVVRGRYWTGANRWQWQMVECRCSMWQVLDGSQQMVVVDGRLQVQYVVGTGRELIDGSGRWQIAGVVCGRYWTVVSSMVVVDGDCRCSMWQVLDGS